MLVDFLFQHFRFHLEPKGSLRMPACLRACLRAVCKQAMHRQGGLCVTADAVSRRAVNSVACVLKAKKHESSLSKKN